MNSLKEYLQQDFKTQREIWQKLLQGELKTDDISGKTAKKTHEFSWPTLSLSAPTHLLKVAESWKKAAQSYISIPANITELIQDDLANGVRLFFFGSTEHWHKIESVFDSFDKKDELVVFLLGQGEEKTSSQFKLVSGKSLISGKLVHDLGGNNIQELGLLALNCIEKLESPENQWVSVQLDSQIFKNIAKVRAAKLLLQKIMQESGVKKDFRVVGLTSFREWTLYERYSNMLRNVASVASGYMAGADAVQSSGYLTLMDIEVPDHGVDEGERSRRMARNTSHILALESMLGVVEDPAFGSFHLEALTEEYAREAWAYMQSLLKLSPEERRRKVEVDSHAVKEKRELLVDTRRHILAGMNEFPDVQEELKLSDLPRKKFYRVSHRFEDLRLKMEKSQQRPEVFIGIFGNYSALNARMNFARNYFELLGLKVREGEAHTDSEKFAQDLKQRQEEIIVICSTDEGYEKLQGLSVEAEEKFVAGKVSLPGFKNIHVGQNAYEVLSKIAQKWGRE